MPQSVVITCMGTRGDVQPLVMLGLALQERGWFDGVLESVRELKPDALVLTSFLQLCGAGTIPQILGVRTRVVVVHLIPCDITSEFCAPTTGEGFCAPAGLGCLNKLNWKLADYLAIGRLYIPRAQALVDKAAAAVGRPAPTLDHKLGCADAPTIYAYSPSLLPKPHDWPHNAHVVGSFCILARPTLGQRVDRASTALARKISRRPTGAQFRGLLEGGGGGNDAGRPIATGDPTSDSLAALARALSHAPPLEEEEDDDEEGPEEALDSIRVAVGDVICADVPDAEAPSKGEQAVQMTLAVTTAHPPHRSDSNASSGARSVSGKVTAGGEDSAGTLSASAPVDPVAGAPACAQAAEPAKNPVPRRVTILPAPPSSSNAPSAQVPRRWTRTVPRAGGRGLPADLQAYIDDSAARGAPVVYVGLGSMLGTAFEPDMIGKVLDTLAEGVSLAARSSGIRGIIHTSLGPGRDAARLAGGEGATGPKAASSAWRLGRTPPHPPSGKPAASGTATDPAWFELSTPVDHSVLLPQVALVVHHGGVGTTQAALAAGKPSIIIPCVPLSDQRFWGELTVRRKLGPGPCIPVAKLTPSALAGAIAKALQKLDLYTLHAERMAYQMQHEDGAARAADIIEASVQAPPPSGAPAKALRYV